MANTAPRKKSPVIRQADPDSGSGYPSLSEHRASRRSFLRTALVAAGAGAGMLVTASGCPFFPDEIGGAVAEPQYYTLRLPAAPEDRPAWLLDGGYARFYVTALTYDVDVYLWADDGRAALTDAIAGELTDTTYDELSTTNGLAAVENRIRDLLVAAYNENTGDVGEGWIQEVELTLTQLDAPELLGGAVPEPSYP